MTLSTAIRNAEKRLISKVKKTGLYENFGQKEVGKLTDKYINSSSYTDEMNSDRERLTAFNNWCMSYNG